MVSSETKILQSKFFFTKVYKERYGRMSMLLVLQTASDKKRIQVNAIIMLLHMLALK